MVLTRRLNVERRRWLGLTVLVLTASALIPAALALACNPQAYLTIDKAQYAPGDSVRVSGSFFKGDRNITLSIDRTGQSATVKTTANGAFQATFALPSGAATGGYSVQAIGFEPDTGDVTPGLPARGSFSVAAAQAAPAQAAPAPSTGGGNGQSAPQASQPAAQAGQPAASQAAQSPASPAAKPAQRPATGQPSPGYREPSVINEPDVQSSGTPRSTPSRGTATKGSQQRTTSRGAVPRSDTAIANGRPVFGGSVAPAVNASASVPAPATAATDRATGAARSSRAAAAGKSASPGVTPGAAEQTAADDVWSAVSSDRSPSVMPIAGDGVAVSSPSAGSQLAVGLLLLGAGVALVGGLAVAATRRRVRVR